MRGIVLACGNTQLPLITYGDGVEVVQVPSRPGKDDVDSHLDADRLIVAGTDADLAAVALRLMRKERLGDTIVGFVPTSPQSAVAALWTLPVTPAKALELALRGDPDAVPLVRDDVGGVLVGLGVLAPVRGVGYCDADLALRGQATRVEVTPDPEVGLGLAVRVVQRRLIGSRVKEFRPRAFQLGCFPTTAVLDGVEHPRPVDKWTWYRHTEDLRLVRGL
ncbi:hypothetical protein Lesp02_54440 [Lentzea sp. NBRC 105346]|uniref:hypothetical protein n=1 Tax=Lentzea sp. NBRC 105346 TaxID=3032205 RepID=UPI0024A524F4|nr:hypothetical protein [Lentzea sp. NBRC 105346]GLZ33256.1 hypothetical protein Lesp02_54440 [Lentzea sp. NBRC 105346]